MNTISGDLIRLTQAGAFDAIVHGCNCFCTMGAGIAKMIRTVWPEVYSADQATKKGDRSKLGHISYVSVTNSIGRPVIVVNAYTQYDYKGKGPKVEYWAIRDAFREVANLCKDMRIGYPAIGAGLAGGDWGIISAIIDEELDGMDHTYVHYAPNR